MSERTPVLVDPSDQRSPHSRPSARADLPALVPLLVVVGLVLSIVGWADVALFYRPMRFGEVEWEFGIIAQTFDALPLPTMATLLLALAARIGARRWLIRAVAVWCALVALACFVLLVTFVLDVPVAFQALERAARAAAQQGAQQNPLAGAALRRGVAKAVLFGTAYTAAWGALSVLLWRSAKGGGARGA